MATLHRFKVLFKYYYPMENTRDKTRTVVTLSSAAHSTYLVIYIPDLFHTWAEDLLAKAQILSPKIQRLLLSFSMMIPVS